MADLAVRLPNDGLNMALDQGFLYVRCRRSMHKYDLNNMRKVAQNVIFNKDGKARAFSVNGDEIYLTDFCDLYILDKSDFTVRHSQRIGTDASSDLGAVRFDEQNAYIGMRNGKMAVMDVQTRAVSIRQPGDSSFWDFCAFDGRIYAGTVAGELLEIDTQSMRALRKTSLGNKNVYSVVPHERLIYTVSQDMTLKAAHIETFEVIAQAKKAVRGMARILGFAGDRLIVADSGKVSIWDASALMHIETLEFPTGQYNKGIALAENTLYGSDFQAIYRMTLEEE